jgi:hypothetical protein
VRNLIALPITNLFLIATIPPISKASVRAILSLGGFNDIYDSTKTEVAIAPMKNFSLSLVFFFVQKGGLMYLYLVFVHNP